MKIVLYLYVHVAHHNLHQSVGPLTATMAMGSCMGCGCTTARFGKQTNQQQQQNEHCNHKKIDTFLIIVAARELDLFPLGNDFLVRQVILQLLGMEFLGRGHQAKHTRGRAHTHRENANPYSAIRSVYV